MTIRTEESKVLDWRISEFQKLVGDYHEAVILAQSDADLEEARRLKSSGCPSHLLCEILL
jgi:hypothetical protein